MYMYQDLLRSILRIWLELANEAPNPLHRPAILRALCRMLTAIEETMERELTVSQAARMTGISCSQIRRWIRNGKITRVGGNGERLRVRVIELPLPPGPRLELLAFIRQTRAALERELT